MSALSRYLLKEHAWPFALGFLLIVFVLLIDVALQFMDRILSKGLAAATALQLLLFNLAWIIALAVPMAVLIAVLMAFARLAADGEILAAKACGISFFSLIRPVLLAASVLSLLMI
ncbi:MAG: LptF/LptG family permease, partial [Candidatus Latescibacterota bacterium]